MDEVTYRCADERIRAQALEQLFGHLSPGDRRSAIEVAERQPNAWRHLWVALASAAQPNPTIVSVVWGQLLPGKLTALFLPRTISDAPRVVRRELLRKTLEDVRSAGAHMVQALTFTDACEDAQLLRELDFWHVADLLYFVVAREDLQPYADFSPGHSAEFRTASQVKERETWGAIIERSYIDSLDCPGLSGRRPVEDVVASFQAMGDGDPALWQLLFIEGRPAGCALIARHDTDYELLYMGLDPDYRGQGWGRRLFAYACKVAHARGAERFIFAADDRNHPAKRIYVEGGGHVWDRRTAFALNFDA